MLKNLRFWILFIIFWANAILGFGFNFYRFFWFDQVLHFLGGLGVYIFLYPYFRNDLAGLLWIKKTILLVGASVMVGVIWEFAEYSTTAIPAILNLPWDGYTFIGDLPDTLEDLTLDTLGALSGSIIYLLHSFRQRKTEQVQSPF